MAHGRLVQVPRAQHHAQRDAEHHAKHRIAAQRADLITAVLCRRVGLRDAAAHTRHLAGMPPARVLVPLPSENLELMDEELQQVAVADEEDVELFSKVQRDIKQENRTKARQEIPEKEKK